MDQETRVTVFQFDDVVECLVYDKDVLRLPSLRNIYGPARANTALIDATIKAVNELKETPERYGDHAFLCYVLTDGQENASRASAATNMGSRWCHEKENRKAGKEAEEDTDDCHAQSPAQIQQVLQGDAEVRARTE